MPSQSIIEAGLLEKDKWRRGELSSLWNVCVNYLGYDKLSESFHKPMLAEWDRVDKIRLRNMNRQGVVAVDTLDLWPRDHIKTWCQRARILRWYAWDPEITVTWWHAVLEMAQESAVAIGETIQKNKEWRKLMPPWCLPSVFAKRFYGANGFTLKRGPQKLGDAPSMRAWGAGSEATGGHSRIGVLDDPIGYNDVVDSQMPAKIRWFQNTVTNVIRKDGWKDAIGTRWDKDDLYQYLISRGDWKVTVRACLETEGQPDDKGEPVYLSKKQIDKARRDMGPTVFPFQMMNDVSHAHERPWKPERCEHFVTSQEAKGPGFVCVISDPAAFGIGDEDYFGERKRADGTKNFWAVQVWKVRAVGQLQERIWLDGASSNQWSMDEGSNEICKMQRRWNTHYVFIEDQKPYTYVRSYQKIAREQRLKFRSDVDDILLQGRMSGKNARWGAFCARAETNEILICKDTVPEKQVEKFLSQARNWVPRGLRNGLPMDDEADTASYVMDPIVDRYSPRVIMQDDDGFGGFNPYRKAATEVSGGTRHVRW